MARPGQQSGPAVLPVRTPGRRPEKITTRDGQQLTAFAVFPTFAPKKASMANSIAGYRARTARALPRTCGIPDQIEYSRCSAKPLRLIERRPAFASRLTVMRDSLRR